MHPLLGKDECYTNETVTALSVQIQVDLTAEMRADARF